MRSPLPHFSQLPPLLLLLGTFLIIPLLSGCGGYAKRDASSLSERDRTVLATYEKIRAGLAVDNARVARDGAVAMVDELKKDDKNPSSKRLQAQAQALANARALDTQRQLFGQLSASLIPLAAGVDGYYIMASPAGLGGEWIQRTPDLDNPYLGQIMHGYGSLKK